MQKKISFSLLVPVLVAALFTSFNFFDFYKTVEHRVYDILLAIKPEVPEDPSILLLDVDDTSLANVGVWPWSREIMAEGLITMKEFNAAYTVFDIEYTEQSPRGINSELLNEQIPKVLSGEFQSINRNVNDLFRALKSRAISYQDAEDYLKDLQALTEQSKNQLLESIGSVVKDNDIFLGQAARFFENAYFTINMLPSGKEDIPDELRKHALESLPLPRVRGEAPITYTTADIRPAIYPVLSPAAGAGFPNVEIDEDGVRRRLYLILEYQGKYYPQLAFSSLYAKIGSPDITIQKDRIILENAEMPGKGKKTVTIPLAEDGMVLINWPKKTYWESFRHLSYWYLELYRRQTDALVKGLELMEADQYLTYHSDPHFLDVFREAQVLRGELLKGIVPGGIQAYREKRAEFFKKTDEFLRGPAESTILGIIDAIINSPQHSEAEKTEYREIHDQVVKNYANLRSLFGELQNTRETLAKNLDGAYCIIGNTATSTTDIGVNPFVKNYENVGTHASIANTILQEKFLDDTPWWYAAAAAFVLSLLVYFLLRNMDPLPSILVGTGFVLFVIFAGTGIFLATGVYPNLITPTLSVFFTFLIIAFIKFLITAREKSHIRNAFGHYLSADVINDLLTNPDKLRLGGEKKYITAMFTDVKGFSTISEQLDPSDLVKLLNAYLTEMCNIILDLRGTIDKFEGDAIISFFGAPVEFNDHAAKALTAAIRMKKAETELNKKFFEDKMTPHPLLTRIGINTGDMVVGNMGTAQKMDYTIMGNAVNLAARLEGVNKQYGTWLLTSEYTQAGAGQDFSLRKLDKVRVVGINTPVRLYEVVDEKSQIPPDIKEAVAIFHAGLDHFENKDWEKAKKRFQEVIKTVPEDGPATTFLKRCDTYIQTPPPDTWDGVFNLTFK
jgi:adenylate cyclase